MNSCTQTWAFFALTFAISVPFWLAGIVVENGLAPGLPVSALMVIAPSLSAVRLLWRARGRTAVSRLISQSCDISRISWRMMGLTIAIMPSLTLVTWAWMQVASVAMPEPSWSIGKFAALCIAFLIAGWLEELGWSGYAAKPMQANWGFLGAGIVIGLVWAIWHWVPLLQAQHNAEWIAWWTIGTIASRVITLVVYERAGTSVMAAALLHASQNLSWQAFPMDGSHFDPRYAAPVFACGALSLMLWRRNRLQRQ